MDRFLNIFVVRLFIIFVIFNILTIVGAVQCASNCKVGCNSYGVCNQCISGYYGDKCSISCSSNCKNGGCQQGNGDCNNGCKPGYRGFRCQTNCDQCQQTGVCNNYYWGDKCEKRCSTNCKNHHSITCIKSSGKCNSGCKDTWYGDTCDNRCSSHCKQTKCNQQQCTPSCTSGCIDGYKGSYCQDTCQENCTSCNRYNNQCTSCKTGWYGDQCQTKCNSNCINGCDQTAGGCVNGCIDDNSGSQCTEILDAGSWDSDATTSEISSLAAGIIGALSSIVVLQLVVIVIGLFCVIKHRNERHKSHERTVRYTSSGDDETTSSPYYNVQPLTNSQVQDSNYESLDRDLQ